MEFDVKFNIGEVLQYALDRCCNDIEQAVVGDDELSKFINDSIPIARIALISSDFSELHERFSEYFNPPSLDYKRFYTLVIDCAYANNMLTSHENNIRAIKASKR